MLLLTLGLAASPGHTHLPGLYGKKFLRSEASPGPAAVNATSPMGRPPDDLEQAYRRQLDELERKGGPYGAGLDEPLSGLARLYRQQGDYNAARDMYDRALHVVRVNDGLDASRQLPLLRDMMEMYRDAGDLEALDQGFAYLYRIAGRQGPDSGQGLQAGLEFLDWQREAHCMGFDDGPLRLLESYLLNERLLQSQQASADYEFESHQRLAASQMENLYLILGQDLEQQKGFGLPSTVDIHASQAASPTFVSQRIAGLQLKGQDRGEDLLRDLIARAEQAEAASELQAGLYLELGDWFQWNGDTPRAILEYTRVLDLLQASGRDDLIDAWLGQPAELPGNGSFCGAFQAADGAPAVYVASYQVSARGQVSAVEVSADSGETSGRSQMLARMLRHTHFRPRFEDGQPEVAEQVVRRYVLRY